MLERQYNHQRGALPLGTPRSSDFTPSRSTSPHLTTELRIAGRMAARRFGIMRAHPCACAAISILAAINALHIVHIQPTCLQQLIPRRVLLREAPLARTKHYCFCPPRLRDQSEPPRGLQPKCFGYFAHRRTVAGSRQELAEPCLSRGVGPLRGPEMEGAWSITTTAYYFCRSAIRCAA